MRSTEHTANAALHAAAQRIEWEDAHSGMWMRPAPKRAPRRADRRAEDYVIAALLVCVIMSLALGVL